MKSVVDGEGVEAQSQLAAGTEGMEGRRQEQSQNGASPKRAALLKFTTQLHPFLLKNTHLAAPKKTSKFHQISSSRFFPPHLPFSL